MGVVTAPFPTQVGLITADEFLVLAEEEGKTELVRGKVVRMPPAGYEHCDLSGALTVRIGKHALETGAGRILTAEPGFILARDPDTVRAPDIAFIRADRAPPERILGFFNGAPDLAIEVVSPSETSWDIEAKVRDYLAAGTRLVWVVYPDLQAVRVFRLNGTTEHIDRDRSLSGEDVLPGFELPLEEIFA